MNFFIHFLVSFFFIVPMSGRRFCAWGSNIMHKASNEQVNSLIRPNLRKQEATNDNQYDNIEKMLHRNEEFRSYKPHYLHSYSYSQPITPHIYFGQLNSLNKFVFLVKNNETLPFSEAAGQIFYINGKQQYGAKNFLSQSKTLLSDHLQFAMVIQIENMLNQVVNTSITVYYFRNFIGIICHLYKDYYKQFIVYISDNGERVLSLSQLPEDLSIEIKNSTKYQNQHTWRNAHEAHFLSVPTIKLQENNDQPYSFSTFALVIKYNSIQSAKRYKIAVREFPFRQSTPTAKTNEQQIQEYHSLQQIKEQMDQIDVDQQTYKLSITNKILKESCQVKAEQQLFQGLSYEYGTLVLKNGSSMLINQPGQLFSFTPSRKRFPWGFLWDDGFHCESAVRSQPQIAIKVIKSWLDTMLPIGWIPRQQNRGAQRQYLCNCSFFMAKDISDGNPPTLLLSIDYLSRKNLLSNQNFPLSYFQKLQKWYKWFLQTQMSQNGNYIFRWKDSLKTNDVESGSFNSGMDDFPRMNNSYGHVDCQAWMYFFAKTMAKVSYSLNVGSLKYEDDALKIKQKFIYNFIQNGTNVPKDYSLVDGKRVYSSHFGYPSILPLALNLLSEQSLVFNSTISKLQSELDSGYGILSLSKYDGLYLKNSDAYWRGPVWMNINYLLLRGLKLYYGSQDRLYEKIRNDLIRVVCSEQETRGYFYENYINGRGSFSYPFTGWTTLISIIIRQNY